jgi:hypothetical protein
MGDELWRMLELRPVLRPRLGVSREGTDWEKVLRILTIYRLLSPGSEWRLHRHWFGTTALSDLLGVDERAVQDDTLVPLPGSAPATEGRNSSKISGNGAPLSGLLPGDIALHLRILNREMRY